VIVCILKFIHLPAASLAVGRRRGPAKIGNRL